ncbi:MAG: insulinase family protein [bacterium]|nr:insulinase family protein [bacterium]
MRPPTPVEPTAPIVDIDLAPRCLEIADLPTLSRDLGERVPTELAAHMPSPEGDAAIWVDADTASPFARIAIGVPWPRVEADDAAIAGLLLSEGWTARDPEGFRARAARRGAQVRVDTTGDRLWLAASAPTTEAAVLTDLLDEVVAFASVDEETFAHARRRARLARLAAAALPATVARDRLDRLRSDPAKGAAKPPRDRAALRATLRTRFVEALDRTLVFQGFAKDRVAALGEWTRARAGSAPDRADPAERVARESEGALDLAPTDVLVVGRRGAPQVEILLAIPNAPGGRDDAPLLEVLASAVGGNVGGRLFADLRERQGLVYTIDAAQDPDGLFFVTTRARAPRVPAVVAGVEAHLRALVDVPFLDCEVATLAQRMRGEDLLERADADARYAALRTWLSHRRRPAGVELPAHPIGSITSEALRAVAHRHLNEAPIVVLVGDADAIERAFETVAPERRLRTIDDEGRID